jgi:flagella basal body P-ring formation protein FlgA
VLFIPYPSRINKLIRHALLLLTVHLSVTHAETLETSLDHETYLERSAIQFLAAEIGESASGITIKMSDSRLRIPACPSEWLFEKDKPSQNLLTVECQESEWKLAFRYEIDGSAAGQRDLSEMSLGNANALLSDDLGAGHKLQIEDFALGVNSTLPEAIRTLIETGVFMKVPAAAGAVITASMLERGQHVLIAREYIPIGQLVSAADFERTTASSVESANALPTDYTFGENTKASANIAKGAIVSRKAIGRPIRVLVAETLIRPGETFTDLNTEHQEILTGAPDGAVSDLSALGRSVATSQIQPGSILRYIDARREEDVQKGEAIRLTVARESFQLEMDVIALESAFIGDTIKLTNPESGATITATVSGKNRAIK